MVAAFALAAWAYLILLRGGFWRFRVEEPPPSGDVRPSVCAIVPARNEAEVVGRAVSSLRAQNYPELQILLVDDGSKDRTAEIAASAGGDRIRILPGASLPPGWTGKLWAMSQGIEAALAADYYWFTDADIVHTPESLSGLVARAEGRRYDLVSYMALLRCRSRAEKALIPAFVFFFFMLYPPAWIRKMRSRTAGAAGGCILIRRDALERAGGLQAIRGELIDDCALARVVKRSGGRVWLGLSREAESIREYSTFGSVGAMIARTAFTQLNYSTSLLVGTLVGLTIIFLSPPLLAAFSRYALLAWIIMAIAYAPALRFYALSAWRAPLLPVAAVFYMASTLASAVHYWRGEGGKWKGRTLDVTAQKRHSNKDR